MPVEVETEEAAGLGLARDHVEVGAEAALKERKVVAAAGTF